MSYEYYVDYMSNQPMRDGEEMRNFFDNLDAEKETEKKSSSLVEQLDPQKHYAEE